MDARALKKNGRIIFPMVAWLHSCIILTARAIRDVRRRCDGGDDRWTLVDSGDFGFVVVSVLASFLRLDGEPAL